MNTGNKSWKISTQRCYSQHLEPHDLLFSQQTFKSFKKVYIWVISMGLISDGESVDEMYLFQADFLHASNKHPTSHSTFMYFPWISANGSSTDRCGRAEWSECIGLHISRCASLWPTNSSAEGVEIGSFSHLSQFCGFILYGWVGTKSVLKKCAVSCAFYDEF